MRAYSTSAVPTQRRDAAGIIANPGKAKQGAPVLQVYEDYRCPACASIHRQISPLVNALAEKGEIGLEGAFTTHMDRCLGCMACVTACPSGVQYDQLLEATRPQIERNVPRSAADKAFREAIFALFPRPERLRLVRRD